MVFTNLGTNEKDAFFTLLDEYFASRPEILNATQGGSSAPTSSNTSPFRKEVTGPQAQAAVAAVGRAGNAAAKFVSTGLKNVRNSNSNNSVGKTTPGSTTAEQHGDSNSMDTQSGGTLADRIAALQGSKKNDTGGNSVASSATDRGSVSNLSSGKKFGDVDTSSTKNFFGSIRNSSSNPPKSFQANQSSNAVDNIPSAFPPKNSGSRFGPPPTRAQAEPEPEPEPEEQGEWAEALYDYESAESGDLELKEGQRVLVIERTSNDWWTGEFDGKKGLFPASYVKLL